MTYWREESGEQAAPASLPRRQLDWRRTVCASLSANSSPSMKWSPQSRTVTATHRKSSPAASTRRDATSPLRKG